MISIEKLKQVKRLITHANCPDGYASALIVKDALPDVEVLFVKHGTEEHRALEPRPGDLFCDFSPHIKSWDASREGEDDCVRHPLQLKHWLEAGTIVLDHHPTQRDVTMLFVKAGLGAYGENDRNECGAWLAYEHVWKPLRDANEWNEIKNSVHEFAELAGIRDTWKKHDERWQEACWQAEALMFWGNDALTLGIEKTMSTVGSLGPVLFDKKVESANNALKEAHPFVTKKGTLVHVFQGVYTTSDAAEILEKSQKEKFGKAMTDIVAGFHYRVDADKLQLTFSTRSHSGYDVGAFCKAHGGGGHTAAAGFTVEQSAEVGSNPYAVFRCLLEEWETEP